MSVCGNGKGTKTGSPFFSSSGTQVKYYMDEFGLMELVSLLFDY